MIKKAFVIFLGQHSPRSLFVSRMSAQRFAGGGAASLQQTSAELALAVEHNPAKHEFTLLLDSTGSCEPAILQYDLLPGNVVDLYHTGVPEAYRGRGVAKHLAKAALDHFASKDDSSIRLSCTYLQKYVRENPLAKYTDKLEQS